MDANPISMSPDGMKEHINVISGGRVSPEALGEAIKQFELPKRRGQPTYPLRESYKFGSPYTPRKKKRRS